jgi:hypothetical protein
MENKYTAKDPRKKIYTNGILFKAAKCKLIISFEKEKKIERITMSNPPLLYLMYIRYLKYSRLTYSCL